MIAIRDVFASLSAESDFATPVRKALRRARIDILDGVHAGAKADLSVEELHIGSALDNDLVLVGDDLEPHHALLRIVDLFGQRVIIEAIDQAVLVGSDRFVDIGQRLEAALPVDIVVGQARLRISGAVETRSFVNNALAVIGAFCIGYALVGFLGSSRLAHAVAFAPSAQSAASAAHGDALAVADRLAAAMRDRLAEVGLGGQVKLERTASGEILATGAVEPSALATWRDAIKWFDLQGGAAPLINSVNTSAPSAALPKIRSIWFDGAPQLVLAHGQTAGVGDALGDGWKVERIDATGVVLSRADGRTARIVL